ncbi:MAG: cell division protein FtsL [Succinivibrio sp.]|nr:cell division protein FtsL [Succinivibrio sp.]
MMSSAAKNYYNYYEDPQVEPETAGSENAQSGAPAVFSSSAAELRPLSAPEDAADMVSGSHEIHLNEVPDGATPAALASANIIKLPPLTGQTVSTFQGNYSHVGRQVQALIPTVAEDLLKNVLVYILALLVGCAAVYKIRQVQETRMITATLNEINSGNDNLNSEWLALLADKQTLTENVQIKKLARDKLGMAQPRTEDEVVIRLTK